MSDEADAAGLHAAKQARALHARAEAGGLRFEAYLPPDLATWILDKIARGVFAPAPLGLSNERLKSPAM